MEEEKVIKLKHICSQAESILCECDDLLGMCDNPKSYVEIDMKVVVRKLRAETDKYHRRLRGIFESEENSKLINLFK